MEKLALAIFKIKASNRVGDAVRAAASMVLTHDMESYEADEPSTQLLWEMAASAGFPTPAWMTRKLRRASATARRFSKSAAA
jgi:hypothetical protein